MEQVTPSENPYHWRNVAADEEKADRVREVLGMPDLRFQSSIDEMFVQLEKPPTNEIKRILEKSFGCTIEPLDVQLTRLSFPHTKHVADNVLVVLKWTLYIMFALTTVLFLYMSHSAVVSEYFSIW